MGKVIVYGYTQFFAVNMKVQVYANGVLKGEVSKEDKIEFDIDNDTMIELKCSFRKASIMAYNNKTNEIKISFDRLTGAIKPQMIQANGETHGQKIEKAKTINEVPEGKKLVNKVAYCLLAFFLGGFGIHKFYAGKIGLGIVYILFSWTVVPSIIAFIEMIIALTKDSDANGNIVI